MILGDKEMYTGTLSNDKGVVMELAAIMDQPTGITKQKQNISGTSFHITKEM